MFYAPDSGFKPPDDEGSIVPAPPTVMRKAQKRESLQTASIFPAPLSALAIVCFKETELLADVEGQR